MLSHGQNPGQGILEGFYRAWFSLRNFGYGSYDRSPMIEPPEGPKYPNRRYLPRTHRNHRYSVFGYFGPLGPEAVHPMRLLKGSGASTFLPRQEPWDRKPLTLHLHDSDKRRTLTTGIGTLA